MTPMFIPAAALGQSAAPAASSSPPTGSTTPQQMRRFYSADSINFNGVPGDGRGMTIAIVDAFNYSTAQSDLHQFDTYYDLPDPPVFQVLNESGQASNYPAQDSPGGWGIEASLDIEWAHAMAPLANITLVEASSAYTSDLFQAAVTAANLPNTVVVSMSFGTPEVSYEASFWDSNFVTPANHGGVTFVAATGDKGTPGTYPAFSPNVVAVGGTGITYASDGTYISETAWSGTGGGTSAYEPRPSYQNGVQTSAFRTIPDVSMDAQPSTGVAIYDSYDNGTSTPWAKFGGTSLATPMFAGLVAIADQGRVSVGQSRLDGRSQFLPALYALSQNDFHDITTGASTGGASAAVGYDLATGIGSPVANKMVNDLAGAASVASQSTGTGASDTFTLTLDTDQLYVDWSNGVTSGQTAIVDPNGLTLNGSGGNDILSLNFINGNPLPNLLKLNGTFTVNGLSGNNPLAGKMLDINRSTLYISYTPGSDPLPAIQQYLANAYNGSAWTGQPSAVSGVITSSAAAANPLRNTSIGYVDAADRTGYNPTANTIELAYTLMGDTNLDGSVTATDYNNMAANYKQPGTFVWDQGSFDYSGAVTFTSFSMLAANYGSTLAPAIVPAATTDTDSTTTTTGTTTTSTTSSGTSIVGGLTPTTSVSTSAPVSTSPPVTTPPAPVSSPPVKSPAIWAPPVTPRPTGRRNNAPVRVLASFFTPQTPASVLEGEASKPTGRNGSGCRG